MKNNKNVIILCRQQLEKMVKFEYDSKYFFNAFDKWRR